MKRLIMIGKVASGKTTLCQLLNNEEIIYKKTQTIQIFNNTMIDTPGEYLEQGFMRGALSVAAADADMLVLIQDCTEDSTKYPPAFTANFTKPAIGVVTKCDIGSEKQISHARQYLEMAGCREIFCTSCYTKEGIKELIDYLYGEDTDSV